MIPREIPVRLLRIAVVLIALFNLLALGFTSTLYSKYLGGGDFEAIEGNTSAGNDSNGGEVMRRVRNLTQVDGFGRIG